VRLRIFFRFGRDTCENGSDACSWRIRNFEFSWNWPFTAYDPGKRSAGSRSSLDRFADAVRERWVPIRSFAYDDGAEGVIFVSVATALHRFRIQSAFELALTQPICNRFDCRQSFLEKRMRPRYEMCSFFIPSVGRIRSKQL